MTVGAEALGESSDRSFVHGSTVRHYVQVDERSAWRLEIWCFSIEALGLMVLDG